MAVRLRGGDLMARLGGDEFVMVQVTEAKARDHIRQVADRVLHGLQQPVRIENHEVRVGCSLGGSLWPLDHAELDDPWSWPTKRCIAPSTPGEPGGVPGRDRELRLKHQPTSSRRTCASSSAFSEGSSLSWRDSSSR
ncbi:diguanylate cyclase domain-containing protein [Pseudomonas subflava]|uniref:diguanylate cyclase domain-containing protein n=1 Tax=Pseudomonas subflava TaxID=2952933 RepID=UPI00331585BF